MSSRNDSSNSLGAGDDDISQDESQTKAAEARRLRKCNPCIPRSGRATKRFREPCFLWYSRHDAQYQCLWCSSICRSAIYGDTNNPKQTDASVKKAIRDDLKDVYKIISIRSRTKNLFARSLALTGSNPTIYLKVLNLCQRSLNL